MVIGALVVLGAYLRLDSCHDQHIREMQARRPAADYNPEQICPQAFDETLDFSDLKGNHFEVQLSSGCFGGWVKIPTWWNA